MILKYIVKNIIRSLSRPIVDGYYGDFWIFRQHVLKHPNKLNKAIYYAYLDTYGAWIGLEATIESAPKCPHECYGLFISNSARIGKNVVIFQQVTIGSVSTMGSKHWGAPTIGDNVLIGVGARIVGGGENWKQFAHWGRMCCCA